MLDGALPPYLSLLKAIEEGVRSGELAAGARLPPHRVLAARLGLSLSTVTKTYHEASSRGVVVSRIGQGTFVAAAPQHAFPGGGRSMTNMGTNISPDIGQRAVLSGLLAKLAQAGGRDRLFASDWHYGDRPHRAAMAGWFAAGGFRPDADQVVATNGAQHALDLALHLLCKPGDTILVEALTYVGFKAQAGLYGYELAPVAMDGEGLLPDALEARIRETGARTAYAMPTLQSPTGRTMSPGRRTAVARILRRHQVRLIEDDVYGFLAEPRPMPIAGLIPDLACYIGSYSKIFGLGYRAGALIVPPGLADRARLALRATNWSATPLLFEIVLRLIRSGELDRIVGRLRDESRDRIAVAREVFDGGAMRPETSYHAWLELPPGRSATELFFLARDRGVLITPPGSASTSGQPETGVRLCLGAPERHELRPALATLKALLNEPLREELSVA